MGRTAHLTLERGHVAPDVEETRGLNPYRLAATQAKATGSVTLGISGLVLLGWLLEVHTFTSLIPGRPTMKFNTALGMAAAGVALIVHARALRNGGLGESGPSKKPRVCSKLLTAFTFTLGLLTLTEWVGQRDLGIDQLFFADSWSAAYPGRPSVFSAMALMLVAPPLWLGPGTRAVKLLQGSALAGALLGWLSIAAFVYDVDAFREWPMVRTLSLPASVCMLALSYGSFWLTPESSLIRILASNAVAGISARRLLPLGIVLPLVLGWLRLEGQRFGWFGVDLGLLLFSTSMMLGFVGLAWINARNVERLELQRETANRRVRGVLEQTERALARANAYLEAAPGPMLVVKPDGAIVRANFEAELLFGMQRDALIGADASELLSDARDGSRPHALAGHLEGAHTRKTLRDWRVRRSERPVEVDVSLSNIREDDCAIVSIHDISAHREAQRALQRLTERLQLATRAAHLGVWDLDLRTNHIVWDESMYTLYGVPVGSFGGRVEDWASFLWEPDRQSAMAAFSAALERSRAGLGHEQSMEFRVRRPDGALRVIVANMLFRSDASGVPVRVIGTNTDVTLQREAEVRLLESEMRFRNAMEYAAIGMALVGLEGRFIKVNRALCEIVGYSEQELVQLTFQSITHPDDLLADVSQMKNLLHGSISHYHMEKRYIHKQGHVVWVLLSGSLVRSPEGEPRLFVAEVQDVSQRKAAEELLRSSLQEKEVLLREIHHRVKNNLQVISSMLNLQASQLDQPEVQAVFKDSQLRIQTMALLHEQLYRSEDLARIDFGEHLRELVATLARFYGARDRAIETELDVAHVSIDLDTAIPFGLLANELITNALKHAYVGRASGRLVIQLAEDGEGITLVVADDGVGFPADFTFEAGKKMGTTLIRSLTRQLRGSIVVSRVPLNAVTLRVPSR